ncbi:carboxypeptidase-like regulatory domain-containing protein, partial [Bacteroidales bacterium OttesenSCG-928-J19]|nr:carboxypeptidase-like regulatory domain-containing protein [Bacteroidales bacterium OttesenSCG-928-J19]
MKFCGSLLLFLFCSLGIMAQGNLSITGKLLDEEEKQPIVAGSVELLNQKDSTTVKGAFSNTNGIFNITGLKAGKYIAKVTYLGYHTLTQDITLTENKTKTDLGTLYLKPSDFLLQEAVVEGKRPEVVVRNDTIEYDAASYKVPENSVI